MRTMLLVAIRSFPPPMIGSSRQAARKEFTRFGARQRIRQEDFVEPFFAGRQFIERRLWKRSGSQKQMVPPIRQD